MGALAVSTSFLIRSGGASDSFVVVVLVGGGGWVDIAAFEVETGGSDGLMGKLAAELEGLGRLARGLGAGDGAGWFGLGSDGGVVGRRVVDIAS